jgi:outer membrane protein OmpA-like peptidoglycan-associated protein
VPWVVHDRNGGPFELLLPDEATEDDLWLPLREVLARRSSLTAALDDPENLEAFVQALESVGALDPGHKRPTRHEIRAMVLAAVASGTLRLAPHQRTLRPVCDIVFDAADPLVPQADAEPRPSVEEPTTWFEVHVVDEIGEPLDGLQLTMFVDGADRRITTDASGSARVDNATLSNATVKIDDLAALRELVKPRWEQVREGEWIDVQDEHTYLEARAPLPVVRVTGKAPHTLVVQPRVILARIKGMLFDTNKSFLLPKALSHLPRLTALYQQRRGASVLAVGHTDRSGDPAVNDPLSLERAEAMAAFLRDDPAPWLAWYEGSKPASKRWGAHEDGLMLDAVLARTGEAFASSPLRHFQRTRGLVDDGIAGPKTRERLIVEYMAADGTTLPSDAVLLVHGCGESFPLDASGEALDPNAPDEQRDAGDRRVELFFFDGELGVLPAPPDDVSGPHDPQYPEWRRRAMETHEFDVEGQITEIVLDDPLFGVAAKVRVEVTYDGQEPLETITDGHGRLAIKPSLGALAELRYEWQEREFVRRVFTAVDDVASRDGAWQRLVHLGYVRLPEPERTPPDDDAFADALLLFQLDYGVAPSGEQGDETIAMLLRAHDQDLRPWRDRDWELPDDPEPDVVKPKQEVA